MPDEMIDLQPTSPPIIRSFVRSCSGEPRHPLTKETMVQKRDALFTPETSLS